MKSTVNKSALFGLLLLLSLCYPLGSLSAQDVEDNDPAARLTTMSFNIRYGAARDGDNHWKNRKELVIQTIKDTAPDILGVQETLKFQAEYLQDQLTDYTYVGRSREDNDRGEQCGILFRSSRFVKLTEGHFWLSETPDQPGSKSWDSSLPRMATWLKLWDRNRQKALVVINTHFDHRGSQARTESAILIRRFVDRLPSDTPTVLLGDFNAGENSDPHNALFKTVGENEPRIVDAYRVSQPERTDSEGTFNGFQGKSNGARIDWIGVSHSFRIVSTEINRYSQDGRYPSDHFPIVSILDW